MNLLGIKNIDQESNLTLDKINSNLRASVRNKNVKLSILQSHSESKVVSFLHKKRKRIDHIIISPEIWNKNGYLIKETLSILKIPLSILVTSSYKISIFNQNINCAKIVEHDSYLDGYLKILKSL